MNKNKRKGQKYRSMMEFKKRFFPRSFKKRMADGPEEARDLGISLAKETLDKIKIQLAE